MDGSASDDPLKGASPRIIQLMRLLRDLSGGFNRLAQEMADANGSPSRTWPPWRCWSAHEAGPITVGALGGELGLSKAATTSLVDRLEEAGHVRRVRDDRDRRRIHLETTDSADAVARAVLQGSSIACG